ncbi:MAG: beta-phosphoglucomutase [Clostridia bacterium]|nr:beta-phosphoglucomutase [Clostridia bacterium]
MGSYQGVIFDLDGVICFTDKYHYAAWKTVADKLGIEFNETINNRLRGVSRMDSLEIILEKYDGELTAQEKEALAEEKNELYKKLLERMSPADLSPEVKATLDALRAAGLQLAIGSSSKNTKFILQRLELGGYFDAISDGTNITRSKPDPQVFLMAAEFLGLQPEKCLVVEDAQAGIAAAVAGGFDSAGLGEAAQCGQATYAMKTFAELTGICGAIPAKA